MNLFLNIVSAVLILTCLAYIVIKKDKNIAILVMSIILLAMLFSQIVLDEIVRARMLALDSINSIKQISAIVLIINWAKVVLIFILAFYYNSISAEKKERNEISEGENKMEEEA